MKKPSTSENQFIFSIYTADKKGLIGQLLMHFNRSSYDVQSLNVARTDIGDLVLVTLEADVPADVLEPFRHKLLKIVEKLYRAYTELESFETVHFRPYVAQRHSPGRGLLLRLGLIV